VLDALIYFRDKYKISLTDIESERELHIKDGFGTRKHQPDFVITYGGKRVAVEVELSAKAKVTLEKNVRDNYLTFDNQIWITNDKKVLNMIQNLFINYAGLQIIRLEEIISRR